MPAAASSARASGYGIGSGRHDVASGIAGPPATSVGISRWTGPRGSVIARRDAWAIQWAAVATVTPRLALQAGTAEGCRWVSTIRAARSTWARATKTNA